MTLTVTTVLDPREVAASLGDLPTLAPVAVELLRLADDDRASLEDIATAMGKDPALAGQMLRVANSAVYGMGGQTTNLARAASVLGLRTVKLLSLTFSVVTRPDAADPHATLVWRHTLATSALARTISTARDPRIADECFIVGLLGNLGRLALAEHRAYADAAAAAGTLLCAADERAAVGCTSDEVAAAVLDAWRLPAVLGDAVRHRSDPDVTVGAAARIARVLHVADAAARLVVARQQDAGLAFDAFRTAAATHLDLGDEETDALLVAATPALAEIAAMFRSDEPHDVPLDALLVRAKEALARLSLDVVAALSAEQSRAEHLASENRRLAAEAVTDSLTALPNRRAYTTFVEQAVAARLRRPVPGVLGLLIIDLDQFKLINDTYGHPIGDDVLRLVGARLALHCRRDELAARIGGEEFAIVLPVTEPEEIALAAGRVLGAIADQELETPTGTFRVTASIGASWLTEVTPGADKLLYDLADTALRSAKQAGRNRVVLAPPG